MVNKIKIEENSKTCYNFELEKPKGQSNHQRFKG